VARSGGARTTVGLPGTGLSWSVEHGPAAGLPSSRRLRSGQLDAFQQECLGLLRQQLFAAGSQGRLLWDLNLITRLLAVIETPEALQAYLLRARSQDDVKRRAHRCVEAVQEAARLAKARGWLGA
jgi:hypothetical protein